VLIGFDLLVVDGSHRELRLRRQPEIIADLTA